MARIHRLLSSAAILVSAAVPSLAQQTLRVSVDSNGVESNYSSGANYSRGGPVVS
ncbi:MAG: hypothetical protein HYR85_17270 [Planctomycetes bacterium]|nr:hypothetical protein [Planctomycetota bacterium]MBI3844711.1 hypothetical protein [Planctomycetota bacterium]